MPEKGIFASEPPLRIWSRSLFARAMGIEWWSVTQGRDNWQALAGGRLLNWLWRPFCQKADPTGPKGGACRRRDLSRREGVRRVPRPSGAQAVERAQKIPGRTVTLAR